MRPDRYSRSSRQTGMAWRLPAAPFIVGPLAFDRRFIGDLSARRIGLIGLGVPHLNAGGLCVWRFDRSGELSDVSDGGRLGWAESAVVVRQH